MLPHTDICPVILLVLWMFSPCSVQFPLPFRILSISHFYILEGSRRPHTASVNVGVGETVAFKAIFRPETVLRSQAHIRVSVIDNQYEDSILQLVGEGYEDEISLDKIGCVDVQVDPENEEGNMADDDVSGEYPENRKKMDTSDREKQIRWVYNDNLGILFCISL